MAFPVVEATAISAQSTSSNPNSISLPSGVVAGDFLVVMHEVGSPLTTSFPAGWVKFFTQISNPDSNQQVWAYKKAVGGETSVDVTLGGPAGFAANAYRISGVINPAIQPPEGVGIGGKADAPPIDGRNPPPLTPTGGSKDYLWITGYASSESNATSSPSPYGNDLEAGSAGGGRCDSGRRELTAASEDPGSWSIGAGRYSTSTIAIHPGEIGGVATLAGTVVGDTEQDIRDGLDTITLTLLGAEWVAAGATFNAERQAIIDGLVSAQSEAGGWNAVLRPAIPVANVVRTSATVVTITLPAETDYEILADETIEATIPESATDDIADIVAEPTFTITRQPPPFFPQVEDISQGNGTGSPVVAGLPTPVAANDLLLALVVTSVSSAAVFPSPWVVLGSAGVTGVPSSQHTRLTVAYLKASGGETTVSMSNVSQTSFLIVRMTGHRDPDIQAPSVVFMTSVNTSSTPLDPPNLDPGVGSKEYLWFAPGAAEALACNQIGDPPANYDPTFDCQSGAPARIVWTARRELIASSENPGAFAISGAGGGVAATVAVAGVEEAVFAGGLVTTQQKLLLF